MREESVPTIMNNRHFLDPFIVLSFKDVKS